MKKTHVFLIALLFPFFLNSLFSQHEFSQITRLDTIICFKDIAHEGYPIPTRSGVVRHFTHNDTTLLLFREARENTYFGYLVDHVDGGVHPLYMNFGEFYTRNTWRGGDDNLSSIQLGDDYIFAQAQNKIFEFKKDFDQDTLYASTRYNDNRGIGDSYFGAFVLEGANMVIQYRLRNSLSETKISLYSMDAKASSSWRDRFRGLFREGEVAPVRDLQLINNVRPHFEVPVFGNFTPNHYLDFDENAFYVLSPLTQNVYRYNLDLEFLDSLSFDKANWKDTPDDIVNKINDLRQIVEALPILEKEIYRSCRSFSTRIYADGGYLYVLNENLDTCYTFFFDVFRINGNQQLEKVYEDLQVFVIQSGDTKLTHDNFPFLGESLGRIDYWIKNGKLYLLRADSESSPIGLTFDQWQDIRKREIIEDDAHLKLYVYDIEI